jgi:hypothetical protein
MYCCTFWTTFSQTHLVALSDKDRIVEWRQLFLRISNQFALDSIFVMQKKMSQLKQGLADELF